MKICYIANGAQYWADVTLKFKDHGSNIVMWVGPHYFDAFAQKHHPDAKVYPSYEFSRGASLKEPSSQGAIPQKILLNPEFLALKDQVMKVMDRQDDFGCYRRLEREAVFYSLVNYFYGELKTSGVELVMAPEGPHDPITAVIYGIAGLMGLKRVHFDISMVAPVMVMRRGFDGKAIKLKKPASKFNARYLQIIEAYIDAIAEPKKVDEAEPLYMKVQKSADSFVLNKIYANTKGTGVGGLLSYIRRKTSKLFKAYYTVRDIDFLDKPLTPTFKQALEYRKNRIELKKKLKQYYQANVSAEVPTDGEYVLFPLHYEPERTTNPDGCRYYNQIDALLALRDYVPHDVPILVKEHYSQFTAKLHGHRGKSLYFYNLIRQLPNVYLVPLNANTRQLIENAAFTASITGTSCFEAAVLGRKAVAFGQTWFTGCPNIATFDALPKYKTFTQQKVAQLADIKVYFKGWIADYALPGYVSPTNESYFFKKFEDAADMLDNDMLQNELLQALKSEGLI